MKKRKGLTFIILFFPFYTCLHGQAILQKHVSLDVNRQRLDQVLEILSNKGDFYFSYHSSIIRKDSLVSFKAVNKTVKEVLSLLFNTSYEFRESGNYLIIRKAPIRMTLVTQKGVLEEKNYSVSGYVYDESSGAAIPEASIYEKNILAAALTNTEGFFKIKLKSSKANYAELTISKEFYEDTTIKIEPRHDQQLTITMLPVEYEASKVVIRPEDYLVQDTARAVPDSVVAEKLPVNPAPISVQRKGVGKFLLTARQKVQSVNIGKFFTSRPFQVSFVPGFGTHGTMSAQVVNNFSLNILGGYTAGTNGLEIGGLFNIDKKGVKYVQAAGLFNSVGGTVQGLQLAGINNLVFDHVNALQVAGVNNLVQGNLTGLQIAGVYNHVTDSVKGMQLAGVGNFSRKRATGVQVAGVANISNREMKGVQVAGVINYAKKLKGVQIGLINIADSSEGYSIGLVNIVLKGYHQLQYSVNELQAVNLAFKTGNAKLYSILQAGLHPPGSHIMYSFGYGLGSELPVNKQKTISFNPELSSNYLYLGSWKYTNILNRLQLNLSVKLAKFITLSGGPSFSVYYTDQQTGITGYRYPVPPSGFPTIRFSNRVTGWPGWHFGIGFF